MSPDCLVGWCATNQTSNPLHTVLFYKVLYKLQHCGSQVDFRLFKTFLRAGLHGVNEPLYIECFISTLSVLLVSWLSEM